MKYSSFIPAVAFSFLSVTALEANAACKPINGHINALSHNQACIIQQAKATYFPDVTLMSELIPQNVQPTCFTTTLTANLQLTNNIQLPLTGTAYSGLTFNEAGDDYLAAFTAVSAIYLSAPNNFSGWVITKDVVVDPTNPDFAITKEFLTVIGTTNSLKGLKGHLTILGNLFNPDGADFVGSFCN